LLIGLSPSALFCAWATSPTEGVPAVSISNRYS
jgi:hypothetical protein